ncbi:BTB domain-containing protein [Mycena sanguinolenta]|uniref:BTB domain-containing protein n=1 Tax=Mycena sanguinolenta TaxID=230812 RepID=A0A8H6ZJ83_9AGAR|nr:BTB domain-containing protein [Mycena sanguinolenta]
MSSPTPAANESVQRLSFPAFPFVDTPGRTDIVLRTSDGVDFNIQRAILSLVSPVFETMFTLPQAEDPSAISPVIDVQEASPVLDRALRFFYPGTQLTVGSLDELQDVIQVLISKYDMQCLAPSVQRHLERYLASQPLAVYVLAYMNGWEDLARAAAAETLKLPLRSSDDDTPRVLDLIPAGAYHKLLRYHHRCGAAAQKTTRDLSWIPWPDAPVEYRWFTCSSSSCTQQSDRTQQCVSIAGRGYTVTTWFMEYFVGMGDILAGTPFTDVGDAAHPLFIKAMRRANQCSHCRDCVSMHLHQFIGLWKARIRTVIQDVEWKF